MTCANNVNGCGRATPHEIGECAAVETLCRTCLRPITHEVRTEAGFLPREGWYDDCRVDALVCFKAVDYRHVPLSGRERAYYDAGYAAALTQDAR